MTSLGPIVDLAKSAQAAKSSRAKVLAAISKTQGWPSSLELGHPFCQQIDVLTNSLLACKRLPRRLLRQRLGTQRRCEKAAAGRWR